VSLAEHVLRKWADHPERGAPFVARHERPGVPADTRPLPAWLPDGVRRGLEARGVASLYRHQAEALEHIRGGQDVVVATPTASGKSLIYHLAVLSACAEDEGARALYLFPTKALAQDQVVSLDALADACGVAARPHAFDGDTPADARKVIRQAARVVVSNPDMLHRTLMPQHDRWGSFFAGLRLVVLDEVHTYRGVFGSHVANVLRRLRRICAFHGSHPRFVLCSATIANPAEHAAALLGHPLTAITESGAPRERTTFYVYNPPLVDGAKGIRQSYVQATRRVARALAREEVPTIVFANSRLNVERLTRHLQEDLASHDMDPTTVSGYRGGYLPEHRRAIEAGLRSGHVRTVVSTSALELGVDVGQLEACVLAGYPGTIASLWQRAGRAGRRQAPAVVVLVARSEAVDQYLAAHPAALFEQTPEHALLDANHLLIVADHIKCAAFELPFTAGEAFGSFDAERTAQVLGWLAARRLLLEGHKRWQWTGEPWPAQGVALRAIAEGNFTVLDKAHGHRIVGEVDYHAAASTLYPQAIYLVGGETWQVLTLDWVGRRAVVEPVDVDYYTDAVTHEGLKRLATFAEYPLGPRSNAVHISESNQGSGARERVPGVGLAGHGEVRVFEQVVGFKKIRFATGENVGYGEVQLPETELHTTAFWLAPPADLALRLGMPLYAVADALKGLLQALRQVAAVRVMCAARDLGSAVVGAEDDAEGLPTLYLYERYPGGVGLHEVLFEQVETLLLETDRLLGGCGCTDGCPACIGAAALGEIRSRRTVRRVLAGLQGRVNTPAIHVAAGALSA